MQETYRCPECDRELSTLAAVREHVNKDHATKPTDTADKPKPNDGGANNDQAGLTQDEEQAMEDQEVRAAEEDLERGKAAAALEPGKWV